MSERLVMIVSREGDGPGFVPFHSWPVPAGVSFLRSNVEDAAGILRARKPSALVFVRTAADDAHAVSALLGVCSETKRRVPLVVLAEAYQASEATTFFRMGVEDYLSLSDHEDRLLDLVADVALRRGVVHADRHAATRVSYALCETPS